MMLNNTAAVAKLQPPVRPSIGSLNIVRMSSNCMSTCSRRRRFRAACARTSGNSDGSIQTLLEGRGYLASFRVVHPHQPPPAIVAVARPGAIGEAGSRQAVQRIVNKRADLALAVGALGHVAGEIVHER